VFTLKSIVEEHKHKNTSVLAAFMDASKAFDSVLHAKLCLNLVKKRVPICFVKLIYHWCKKQEFKIIWNGLQSQVLK